MIRHIALAALAAVLMTGRALACPEPSETLIWHSCWSGGAEFRLLLLPEDLPLPSPPSDAEMLMVTGAYTGREPRAEGRPDPVGLFVRRGEIVGRNLARMDGILLIGPDGDSARLAQREAVDLDGRTYDLTQVPERSAFLRRAAETGVSVMQSHLLVIDGESDVSEVEAAPAYIRRILFQDADGIGIYESGWPLTLHQAAETMVRTYHARMAINLDMGSYDFCLRLAPGAAPQYCGVFGEGGDISKLSNLLVLVRRLDER